MTHRSTRRFLLLVGIAISFMGAHASAQERLSIELKPTVIEEVVEVGKNYQYQVTVANLGDLPQTLIPTVRDIVGVGADGNPLFADLDDREANPSALSEWISFEDPEVTIAPGARAIISFSVAVGDLAEPGTHMGAISLVQRGTEGVQMGTGVGYELGAIVLLNVQGEIVESARIKSFAVERAVFSEPRAQFEIKLENDGNVFVRPIGIIDITDMFGNKVETIEVNSGGTRVFPRSERAFAAMWESSGFRVGKYEATLALSMESVAGGQRTLSATQQFWVLPMNILGPVIGGLLVFVFSLFLSVKMYVRSQLRGMARGRRTRSSSISRLSLVTIALLIAIIVGLLMLFVFFA